MRFLDAHRIKSNMSLVAEHLGVSDNPSRTLNSRFIEALNVAQSSPIRSADGEMGLDFNNPELEDFFLRKKIFNLNDLHDGRHLYDVVEQQRIRDRFASALNLISDTAVELRCMIEELIGSVACFKIDDRDGGTVSCCIGLIWLSPREEWDVEYFAEMLVHEFVHNSVFLEDMTRCIMPNLNLLEREDAHVTSVIRKTRRAFDKAFHSACVAAGLMYFYGLRGKRSTVDSYRESMRLTIKEIMHCDRHFRALGDQILSDNGSEIVKELDYFTEHLDYGHMTQLLSV